MTRPVVISACYGGYDRPKPPVDQTVDCDWVMVTDDDNLRAPGWYTICAPRPDEPPRLAAKLAKCMPWYFAPAREPYIWIDASIQVTSAGFVEMCVKACPPHGIAAYLHPYRDCIYAEALASIGMPKYRGEPIVAQAAHYAAGGHPEHWGLWACGVMVRDWSPLNERFGQAWLDEQHAWSIQDQLSFPVVARDFAVDPEPLPGNLVDRAWFTIHPHPRESD